MKAQTLKVLVLGETCTGHVQEVTLELQSRALGLAPVGGIGVLLLSGAPLEKAELDRVASHGADLIQNVFAPWLEPFRPEIAGRALEAMVAQYHPEIVLGGASSTGRTLLPYAAMKFNTGLTADCTQLSISPETGKLLQTRPAIGGNIMATIQTPRHLPQMATVRPRSTRIAEPQGGRQAEVQQIPAPEAWEASALTLISSVPLDESQELSHAKKVVVVGRGIKKPENLPMVQELASLLGAALGATREVVDRGWLPYRCQIGLSGRTITPELYVGLGVSGAIQHLAGMQTSRRIVAVNQDPEAQLFSLADLGIVGNLLEVVPSLIARLKKGEAL